MSSQKIVSRDNAVKIRTIVKEKTFEKELAVIEANVKRSDEFLIASEWALARNPAFGYQIPKTNVWIYRMSPIAGNPASVSIYYTFDEDCVYLISIKAFK